MITFKEYIAEAKYPDPTPIRMVTMQELQSLLSKGQLNSLRTTKEVKEIANMEHFYRYGVTPSGFAEVEVYAYYSSVHRTPEGRIRPERMVRVMLDPRKVISAQKYHRTKESNDWRPL